MKERLLEFLRSENKSSAQLAEEIGVQPSGISHILSGRNNPSLDFVLKMLGKYQSLSSDWLLFGKGTMYKDIKIQSLFDEALQADLNIASGMDAGEPLKKKQDENPPEKELIGQKIKSFRSENSSEISHIVIFYTDKSFEEYISR